MLGYFKTFLKENCLSNEFRKIKCLIVMKYYTIKIVYFSI